MNYHSRLKIAGILLFSTFPAFFLTACKIVFTKAYGRVWWETSNMPAQNMKVYLFEEKLGLTGYTESPISESEKTKASGCYTVLGPCAVADESGNPQPFYLEGDPFVRLRYFPPSGDNRGGILVLTADVPKKGVIHKDFHVLKPNELNLHGSFTASGHLSSIHGFPGPLLYIRFFSRLVGESLVNFQRKIA